MEHLLAIACALCACGRIGFASREDGGGTGNDGDSDMLATDDDSDGVVDSADNCLGLGNPTQANEDGDAFGDVCDQCPIFASDVVFDMDGDSVDDFCDPFPAAPGDRIVVFEGFAAGLPASWPSLGTWVPSAGTIGATPAADEVIQIELPIAPDDSATTRIGFDTGVVAGTTSNQRGLGIVAPTDGASGLGCYLYIVFGSTNREAGLVQYANFAVVSAGAYAWGGTSTYQLTQGRMGNLATCVITDGTTPQNFSAIGGALPPAPLALIGTRSIAMRLHWVMHVDSP